MVSESGIATKAAMFSRANGHFTLQLLGARCHHGSLEKWKHASPSPRQIEVKRKPVQVETERCSTFSQSEQARYKIRMVEPSTVFYFAYHEANRPKKKSTYHRGRRARLVCAGVCLQQIKLSKRKERKKEPNAQRRKCPHFLRGTH